ncbi:MAG: hypothetical protein ACI93R_003634 [Flavobacteriales bacterium]|jgi:hypothetical protein
MSFNEILIPVSSTSINSRPFHKLKMRSKSIVNIRSIFATFFSVLYISVGSNLQAREKSQIYQRTNSFSYSEVSPIKQFANSLEGPAIDAGGVTITSTQFELGNDVYLSEKYGGFSYGLVSRFDYFLEFTNDTAEIFYADKNDVALDQNRTYSIDLKANHVSARGFKLGYLGKITNAFDYQIHMSFINAYSMLVGRLTGELNGLGGDTSGDLVIDYQYSRDTIFDREESELTADGRTVDAAFQWQPTKKLSFEFYGRDIYSEIAWKGQDRTVGGATSNRVRFGDDGLLNVRPALFWQESERDLNQVLPVQMTFNGAYQLNERDTFKASVFTYEEYTFTNMAYSHRFFKNVNVGLSYNFDLDAVGFEFDTRFLKLKLSMDDYDYTQAKSLSFDLGFYFPIWP